MVITKTISPEEAGKLLGKSRESIVSLIRAGELLATDERMPGAKIPLQDRPRRGDAVARAENSAGGVGCRAGGEDEADCRIAGKVGAMSRIKSRNPTGRFQRASLVNTFGLDVIFCPNPLCGLGNPHGNSEPPPIACHACGQDLRRGAKIGYQTNGATLPTRDCSEWIE